MDSELFTLISMAARYWFCALMLFFVFRACQVYFADSKNARLLRKWSPETGCVGQFVVNPGRGKDKSFLPIPREGTLGSSRSSDIRIRSKSVKSCHLTFETREGGLLIKPRDNASVMLNDEYSSKSLFAKDGDTLTVGDVRLLLVIFGDNGTMNIVNDETDEIEGADNDLWQDD